MTVHKDSGNPIDDRVSKDNPHTFKAYQPIDLITAFIPRWFSLERKGGNIA